jgi:hypothetical protein
MSIRKSEIKETPALMPSKTTCTICTWLLVNSSERYIYRGAGDWHFRFTQACGSNAANCSANVQGVKAKIHYIQHAHGVDLQGRILVKDSVVEHAWIFVILNGAKIQQNKVMSYEKETNEERRNHCVPMIISACLRLQRQLQTWQLKQHDAHIIHIASIVSLQTFSFVALFTSKIWSNNGGAVNLTFLKQKLLVNVLYNKPMLFLTTWNKQRIKGSKERMMVDDGKAAQRKSKDSTTGRHKEWKPLYR